MIKTLLSCLGVIALATLIALPFPQSAAALSPPRDPSRDGVSFSMAEAVAIMQSIIEMEANQVAAKKALSDVLDRIAKQDALVAAKDAEIKKLEIAVAAATGKRKEALEFQLRAARFDRLKLDGAYRILTSDLVNAKKRVALLAEKIAERRAWLDKYTSGACTVSNGTLGCVL